MKLLLPCFLLVCAAPLAAQREGSSWSFQARLGAVASTTLVRDDGASGALSRALGNTDTDVTELKLRAAPVASLLLATAFDPRVSLEGSATIGFSQLIASNAEADWEAQSVTISTLAVGIRYEYWREVWINGGVGITRFFSDSRGIFSQGNNINPLLEAGVMTSKPFGNAPLHLAARIQTHAFGTAALRREGAGDGKTIRLLLQLGFGR